ncbi:hypothetical protein SG34_001895 [Thalassomonas viridans]|uniref:Uncharacterized protein n=1 Tax=Thalassomonas viridans TaxID=137584 RepID=A0AAE9Z2R4_9GAMM|nr:hypothetical protein [Thalassomonas viridans]WDE05711.1 hypothetical protein SG34_001895 [Thalassomonas viridans]
MKVYFYITGNLAAETLILASDALKRANPELNIQLLTDGALPTLPEQLVTSTMVMHDLDNQDIGLSPGDVVITGMMWPGNDERKIFREAKENGALSVVLLPDISGDANKFCYRGELYLPDFICVSDKITYDNLVQLNIPKKKIVTVGSLYLDSLFKNYIPGEENKPQQNIGYLSVPNRKDFINWGCDYGFGEVEIAEDLVGISRNTGMDLLIRKHPKELSSAKYDHLENSHCQVTDHNAGSITAFIEKCDVVVSTYSTSLIIAMRMGRKAISYQPDCTSPVRGGIYERLGIPVATSYQELSVLINNSTSMEGGGSISDLLFNSDLSEGEFVNFINRVAF